MNYYVTLDGNNCISDLFSDWYKPDGVIPVSDGVAKLCMSDGKFGIRLIAGKLAGIPCQRIIPSAVTRYQGRAALLQMGLLDDIDAHYAALPTDTADEALNLHNRMAKERWAGMLNFERDSEELVELASAFGMSATQVDDLFCFAETIK